MYNMVSRMTEAKCLLNCAPNSLVLLLGNCLLQKTVWTICFSLNCQGEDSRTEQYYRYGDILGGLFLSGVRKNPQHIGIQSLSSYRLAFDFHSALMRDDKISISLL